MHLSLILAAALLTVGCASVKYGVRPDYVGFTADSAKTVEQTKKTSMFSDELHSTYDDEFVYDEEGTLIKHIQTHFFDEGKKFTEYVVVYQKIGESVLPKSVSINGFEYMQVEYDLLASDHQGAVEDFTVSPVFYQVINNPLKFQNDSIKWDIDLANFKVPFRSDGEFVTTDASFDYFTGLSEDKVLTLGYNNVVLKRFYFSPSRYRKGYNVSHGMGGKTDEMTAEEDKVNTTFEFTWAIIADRIVQTGMLLTENDIDDSMIFRLAREFDDAGRRTSEVWTVTDSIRKTEEPVVLYSQKLTY